METINALNKEIKQMALEQNDEKMREWIEKRNEYIMSFEGEKRLELFQLIQAHDQEIIDEISKAKEELQQYITGQVAKKRASQKYQDF